MKNPNPNCEGECRFEFMGGVTTCMYFTPVYDKYGNNTNPDGNITTGSVKCNVCRLWWHSRTQYGETMFTEMTR